MKFQDILGEILLVEDKNFQFYLNFLIFFFIILVVDNANIFF